MISSRWGSRLAGAIHTGVMRTNQHELPRAVNTMLDHHIQGIHRVLLAGLREVPAPYPQSRWLPRFSERGPLFVLPVPTS